MSLIRAGAYARVCRRFIVPTLVAAVGALLVLLTACSAKAKPAAAQTRTATSASPSAATSAAPSQSTPLTSAVPATTRALAPRRLAVIVAAEHAGQAQWGQACADIVATTDEISVLNYHGAPVTLKFPAFERNDDMECIYQRQLGVATSQFRVYARAAAAHEQPSVITGDTILVVNGIRMELSADGTGDTDVSLPIGATQAREFLQSVVARIVL